MQSPPKTPQEGESWKTCRTPDSSRRCAQDIALQQEFGGSCPVTRAARADATTRSVRIRVAPYDTATVTRSGEIRRPADFFLDFSFPNASRAA
jgi:hypothetical protein